MGHGIEQFDKGFVSGVKSTWHRMKQYVCLPDRAVSIDEAMSVARYPLKKMPLFRNSTDPNSGAKTVDAWAIVRSDHDITLLDAVGSKFSAMGNEEMVHYLHEGLLCVYPELHVETVGTLGNGATFFIGMKMDERQVKGDKSPIATTLMYTNPLGRAYSAFACTERVLCANTLRIAEAQGVANDSVRRFGHFSGAKEKISDHLIDMGRLRLCLDDHFEMLNHLSGQPVTDSDIDAFLSKVFPMPLEDGRKKTMASTAREQFTNIFFDVQSRTLADPYTKYGLLQAYTDWVDHTKSARGQDEAAVIMDGLTGGRAGLKHKVLSLLTK